MKFRTLPKLAAAFAATAILAQAPMVPLSAQSEKRSERRVAQSPVHCELFQPRDYRPMPSPMVKSGNGVAQPSPRPVAPPPPPPSPPPPPTVAQESAMDSVVVTGTRVRTGAPRGAVAGSVASSTPYYPYPVPQDREQYDGQPVASIKRVAETPVSTFAVDVDTGSYSNVRRMLNDGQMPPADAVRTEEMINYFRYDYPKPGDRDAPFSINFDVAQTPWNSESRLLRIGLRGYDASGAERPRANLVFLVDVSGSMNSRDKLPLVKSTLLALADELQPDDRVSIVVYASAVGTLLEPTSNKAYLKQAVECMQAGGSTAGESALRIAYDTARANYDENGINRIVMTTDGDFNVGVSGTDELKEIVAKERESGVTLTMLGYGTGNIRDELMEGIANVGNGNYAYIDSAMEAKKVLGDELSATLFTIAKDVKVQVEFNPKWVKEYRLIGYENRLLAEEDFDNDKVDAGDIGAGHQVTALYEFIPYDRDGWLPERRYEGNKTERMITNDDRELAFVKLRYKLPKQDNSRLIERPVMAGELYNPMAPRGDMAFVTAVAAFGQKLRGDKYLGDFSYEDIEALSGEGGSFWRQQFRQLVGLAAQQG